MVDRFSGRRLDFRAMDHALLTVHVEGAIDVDPPIKRLAVEKGPPILCRFLRVLGMEEASGARPGR